MSIHFLKQSNALSVAEEIEQRDPEAIHSTRQHSLKGEKKKKKRIEEEKEKKTTYTFTPTSFSFSTLALPLTALPICWALGTVLWHSEHITDLNAHSCLNPRFFFICYSLPFVVFKLFNLTKFLTDCPDTNIIPAIPNVS